MAAAVFPPYALDPAHLDDADARHGLVRERETLARLRAALPNGYTIFHSTHLVWSDGERLRKREADLLVVNRAGQVLMIEQKTGRLEEEADGLRKAYGDGGSKCVVTQCHEVTVGLRRRLRDAQGPGARLDINFVLY